MEENQNKTYRHYPIECYRCNGIGVIPWGDAPDESDPCDECEGHGYWLLEEVQDERVA